MEEGVDELQDVVETIDNRQRQFNLRLKGLKKGLEGENLVRF